MPRGRAISIAEPTPDDVDPQRPLPSSVRPGSRDLASCSTSARSCADAACASSSRPSHSSRTPTWWWQASVPTTSATARSRQPSPMPTASTSQAPWRPADIPDWTNGADVSAMPVQPDTLNHRFNTPTKLYDAMGVGRAGGRQQAARYLAHRHRDRLRRALRPDRSRTTSRAPSRKSSTHPPKSRPARCACAVSLQPARRTRGSDQTRELLRVYGELGVLVEP